MLRALTSLLEEQLGVPAQPDPAAAAASALGAAAAGSVCNAECSSSDNTGGGSAAQARHGSVTGAAATCGSADGRGREAGSEMGLADTEGGSTVLGRNISGAGGSEGSDSDAGDEQRAAARGWLVARVLRLRAAAVGATRGALEGVTDVLIREEGERRAAEAKADRDGVSKAGGQAEAWAGLGTITRAGAAEAGAHTEQAMPAQAEDAGAQEQEQEHATSSVSVSEVDSGGAAPAGALAAADAGEFRQLLWHVVGRRFRGMDHLSPASLGPPLGHAPSSPGVAYDTRPPPRSALASVNTAANTNIDADEDAGRNARAAASEPSARRSRARSAPTTVSPTPPPAAPPPLAAPSLLALCCRAIASNTQPLLWAALLANHALDASLLSLPPAVSVLLYAALESPRPARAYPQVLLLYFSIVLFLKAAYQVRPAGPPSASLLARMRSRTTQPTRLRLTPHPPAPTPPFLPTLSFPWSALGRRWRSAPPPLTSPTAPPATSSASPKGHSGHSPPHGAALATQAAAGLRVATRMRRWLYASTLRVTWRVWIESMCL
jgi:hypothetical protein